MSMVETEGGIDRESLRRAGGAVAAVVVLLALGYWWGGAGTLNTLLRIGGLIAAAAALAWLFRAGVSAVLPEEPARVMRSAPLIAPFGQAEVAGAAYAPPDGRMWLGGDQLGRDMLSRIIWGARNTVGIALITTAIAFTIGSLMGLLAAVYGGWVDMVLGRVVDIMLAIPQLVFALLLLTVLGTSVLTLVAVIGVLYAPLVFRLARAVAGGIVVMDYVEAARLRGETKWYLITREILPNATAPLIAEFGLRFCFVFLTIAGLSFLGVGIQPPTADWGSMVRENAMLISFGEIVPLIPAGAIALLTVSINFVVDWMLHRASGLKD
jgi:peptide/nickel transport system permease protein